MITTKPHHRRCSFAIAVVDTLNGHAPGSELPTEGLRNSSYWGLLHISHDGQLVSVKIAVLSEICHEKLAERS